MTSPNLENSQCVKLEVLEQEEQELIALTTASLDLDDEPGRRAGPYAPALRRHSDGARPPRPAHG
jgi:hypothetical protein